MYHQNFWGTVLYKRKETKLEERQHEAGEKIKRNADHAIDQLKAAVVIYRNNVLLKEQVDKGLHSSPQIVVVYCRPRSSKLWQYMETLLRAIQRQPQLGQPLAREPLTSQQLTQRHVWSVSLDGLVLSYNPTEGSPKYYPCTLQSWLKKHMTLLYLLWIMLFALKFSSLLISAIISLSLNRGWI